MDVEIENINSWPPEFREVATDGRSLAISYYQKCSDIEQRLETDDIFLRRRRPENRYKQDYDELVGRLEALLKPHRIIAYHCSRLTTEEIGNIKKEGLRILTADLVNKKLRHCLSHGYLKQTEHDLIKNSSCLSKTLNNQQGQRTGRIKFCANRETLKDSYGIYRFFRSWGGEAMYWGHEQDPTLAHALGRIGAPCIIVCAIPSACIPLYGELPEYFLRYLVSHESEYKDLYKRVEIYTEKNLCSTEILDIIEYSSPQFEELTAISSWPSTCLPH